MIVCQQNKAKQHGREIVTILDKKEIGIPVHGPALFTTTDIKGANAALPR